MSLIPLHLQSSQYSGADMDDDLEEDLGLAWLVAGEWEYSLVAAVVVVEALALGLL